MKKMTKTTRSTICILVLAGLALVGCDAPAPPDPAESQSGKAQEAASEDFQALAKALNDPDPYARARSLGTLLPMLPPEAVAEVKKTLEHFRLELGATEFELLLRFWASHEPAEATAWAFKHASPVYRTSAAGTVIEIWAESDPMSAVPAVETAISESNEEIARVVQMALVQGWFKTDRVALEKYIYRLGSGLKRQRAIFMYALSLAASDGSDAAIGWAESVSEDDHRYKLEVFRQVMSSLAWADMPAALRFCDVHCDGPSGKGLRNVLILTRVRNGDDGAEIVEWVGRVPQGDEQQQKNWKHSLWVAYSRWAQRDRALALAWMGQKVAGDSEPWIRNLYGEYARRLAADSPREALKWAERVEDDVDRERSLIRIARSWRRTDEEAAEAWLKESSLSENARDKARDLSQSDNLPKARSD